MKTNEKEIFKKGSTTYYFSSIFFPANIRSKVATLYAYVRIVDDFVDNIPPDTNSFFTYKKETLEKKTNNEIINNFLLLATENNFQDSWIEAFLQSMQNDLRKKIYETFEELESYMYGSANVIGYMMSAIMQLPEEAYHYAGLQGKAMQLINFIRDIKEDNELGRTYIPRTDMQKFKVVSLQPKNEEEKTQFIILVRYEIDKYFIIQNEAEKGYRYIPKQYLIPIKTASDMYKWTAKQIYRNPLIVFEKKVKPSKLHIFTTIITNFIRL